MIKKINGKTFVTEIYFDKKSKDTFQDKLLKVVKSERKEQNFFFTKNQKGEQKMKNIDEKILMAEEEIKKLQNKRKKHHFLI